MMEHSYQALSICWRGPFFLHGDQGELVTKATIASRSGIYLFTVEYNGCYLIYAAGLTSRSFKIRFLEHMRDYRKGKYTLFDCADLQKGKRTEMWHGMWTKKSTNTPEMRKSFHSRSVELLPACDKLLSTFRIFLAPLDVEKRILERLEAAIMNNLYSGEEPVCSIPDKGMFLAPRRKTEIPLIVDSVSSVSLLGLPKKFEA
jgi:hypothetical protein